MPRSKITPAEIEKYLTMLEKTPHCISALTARMSRARLGTASNPREWSPAQILAHLRACDDIWTHSIYAMLFGNNPTLALLDERRWAKATRYDSLEFHASFQAFALKRDELVRVLRALPMESWSRTANIGGRGHSVFSQARRMALHEAEHCDQIEAMLK